MQGAYLCASSQISLRLLTPAHPHLRFDDVARQALAICIALLTGGLGGCRGREAEPQVAAASPTLRTDVRVTEISLGRVIDPSRRVAEPRDTFAPGDTIYASVVTEGTARHGVLKARWTYQDSEVVSEASLEIAPTDTTATEFHVSRPDGLRAGRYEVEVFFDGALAGKRTFSVP